MGLLLYLYGCINNLGYNVRARQAGKIGIEKDYEEWLEKKMKIRTLLREINGKVALDLLVYTKPQYEQLMKEMNSFQKEIEKTGQVLYEKAS